MENVRIVRSGRKTLSIEVCRDASVLVRAPRRMPVRDIERVLAQKSDWIAASRERILSRPAEKVLSAGEISELRQRAREYLAARAAHYAPIVGVSYGRIGVRSQRTRWGSCSSRGDLSFNCLLMLVPEYVADYVVVHELCHRLEMNHSPRFWSEVGRVLPDYQAARRWLRENGAALIARLG